MPRINGLNPQGVGLAAPSNHLSGANLQGAGQAVQPAQPNILPGQNQPGAEQLPQNPQHPMPASSSIEPASYANEQRIVPDSSYANDQPLPSSSSSESAGDADVQAAPVSSSGDPLSQAIPISSVREPQSYANQQGGGLPVPPNPQPNPAGAAQAPPNPVLQQPPMPLSFKNWVAGLDQQHVKILSQALFSKNRQFNFATLGQSMQLSAAEQASFQVLLQTHTVEYLGGGNSHNFLVTNSLTGAKEVLKLEHRMGNPDTLSRQLQARVDLQDYFVKVGTSKPVSIVVGEQGQTSTRYLQITDYCQGSSLDKKANSEQTVEQRLANAQDIYSQMSEVLLRMERNGAFHPDMKNSNWLMDQQGKLRIADTKALCPIPPEGISLPGLSARGYDRIHTKYLNPPEYQQVGPFSANKAEAYMIAKNLYDFLASPPPENNANKIRDMLKDNHKGDLYDFSAPAFKTPAGKRYKLLICACVKETPAERLEVSQFQQALKAIDSFKNNPQVVQVLDECNKGYKTLYDLSKQRRDAGQIDRNLEAQLTKWHKRMQNPGATLQEITALAQEMNQYHKALATINELQANYATLAAIQQRVQVCDAQLRGPAVDVVDVNKLNNINIALAQLKDEAANPEQAVRFNQLINTLKTDYPQARAVNLGLAAIEKREGVYAKMELREINKRLDSLVLMMEHKANPAVARENQSCSEMRQQLQQARQRANAVINDSAAQFNQGNGPQVK